MSDTTKTRGLRILAADEDESTLRATDVLLAGLGHDVMAHAVTAEQAGDLIARDDPDLSVVVVHDDDDHALDLIEEITEYARGPLIVLLGSHESHFVTSAAERGIDAFARPQFDDEVQGAIELVMTRHAEKARLVEQVEQLESALERRGTIERAKGILMDATASTNARRSSSCASRRGAPTAASSSSRTRSPTATRCCPITPSRQPAAYPRGRAGKLRRMVDKLKEAFKRFQADEMTDRAAALTYYMMMSLFPALLVGVSLLGLLGDRSLVTKAVDTPATTALQPRSPMPSGPC